MIWYSDIVLNLTIRMLYIRLVLWDFSYSFILLFYYLFLGLCLPCNCTKKKGGLDLVFRYEVVVYNEKRNPSIHQLFNLLCYIYRLGAIFNWCYVAVAWDSSDVIVKQWLFICRNYLLIPGLINISFSY